MPANIMQSLKFIPTSTLIVLAVVFLVFIIYAAAKTREVGQFRKKYQSFASRDMFIEDVINSLNRKTIHTFLLFLALIISVFVSGAMIGSTEAELSGPGGKEELDAKYSSLKQDFDTLKEEKERLASRFASLTKTPDADAQEKQLSDNYRAALVNYFYLLKCSSANAYDGMALTAMLSLELSRIGANSNVIWLTVDDARNLYNREYSKNTCQKAAISQINANQKQFMDSITKNVQAALSLTPPSPSSVVSPEAVLSGEIDITKELLPLASEAQQVTAPPANSAPTAAPPAVGTETTEQPASPLKPEGSAPAAPEVALPNAKKDETQRQEGKQ